MADENTNPRPNGPEGATDRTNDAQRLMSGPVTGGSAPAPANRSRTSSDLRPRRNAKNEADVMITEGAVYREKNGTQEVVPFFVDFARARVRFSPLGRSTEDEMRMGEFLSRYEEVEKSALAEATPAESQKDAEARMKKRETRDTTNRLIARNGEPV